MPVASVVHVLVPVQDEPHRPAQQVGRHSCCRIPRHAARLLASKAASNALHVADHLVLGDAQHVCHCLLVLGRRLWTTCMLSQMGARPSAYMLNVLVSTIIDTKQRRTTEHFAKHALRNRLALQGVGYTGC